MRVLFASIWAAVHCAAIGTAAFASPASLEVAKQAYDAGRYQDALKTLQESPQEDVSYFYDLGTVLSKLGQNGPAVAYLEKSNRLQPHDAAIQQNLKIARSSLSKLLGEEHLDPASSWEEDVSDRVSIEEVRGAFGLVGLVLALFWIRSYLKTRTLRKTLLQPAGLFGLAGLALTFGVYAAQRFSESHPAAVCLERQAVRTGPGDRYNELAQIEAGVKVRALGPAETAETSDHKPGAQGELWRQIRFSQDGIGWVKASSVLLL